MKKRSSISIKVTGESILALRESWGMTQSAFAVKADTSRGWVARAERPGLHPISKAVIANLAAACGSLHPSDFVAALNGWDRAPPDKKPPLPRLRMSVHDMIAEGAPIGEDGDIGVGEVWDEEALDVGIRLPVYDRDVAAGAFSFVDEHIAPDDEVVVARQDLPKGATATTLFILRIKGNSMLPKYRSGARVILERLEVAHSTLEALSTDRDYCICQADTGCTFKCLSEVIRGKSDPELVLVARNRRKYPTPFRVPWSRVRSIARVWGQIEYSITREF